MAIVRWDPFGEMMTMQRDMSRLFSSLGVPLFTGRGGDGERVGWMPTVDVLRKGDDLQIRAELPGLTADDVDISLTDDVLTIKGERTEDTEVNEGDYIRKESSYGSFERQIMVPQGTKPEDIHAQYKDGVVTVTVPGAAREIAPETKHISLERPQG